MEALATIICQVFHDIYLPCTMIWNRKYHNGKQITGEIVAITWDYQSRNRKGGGFILWISYRKNKPQPHNIVLEMMFNTYKQIMSAQGINVQNNVINTSKDILIQLTQDKTETLNTIFPWKVRELYKENLCRNWIINHRLCMTINTIKKQIIRRMKYTQDWELIENPRKKRRYLDSQKLISPVK